MSISEIEDILPRYQEIADGNKLEYSVAFDLIDAKFISVYLGSDKQLSGFNVDIENKKIIFESAPNSGLLVTIVRAVPVSWESTLHGAINSEGLNSLLTHIVASIQTVQEEVSRAVKSNIYDQNDGGQLSEFFLKQLTDAQDILDRSENTLSLLNTTVQNALSSIESARSNALSSMQDLVNSAEESEVNAKASENAAKTSETNAKASETKAKQIADSIVNDSADRDLSNLSTTGQAKFDAKQNKLTAGTGLEIVGNTINNTQTSAEWGNIEGDISSQTDLKAALDDKIGKTGDEVKNGSLMLVGDLIVEEDTDNLPPDGWRISTNSKGVYKIGYRFVGGEGIFFSDYNFKYDSATLDSETIISNTNLGGTFGSNIKLTSSTSGKYSEVSLNASQAKAPNPETGDMEKIATYDWVEEKHQVVNAAPSDPVTGTWYYLPE